MWIDDAAKADRSTGDRVAVELSVIVVSYNTRELTLDCLRSVYDQTKALSFEVIVVDNASTDGSAAAIAKEFAEASVMALDNNIGFAAANNLASERASGRYLLLLNPDTVVLDCAVQRLVAFAEEHHGEGIFGGRTLFPDGTLNPTSCWMRPTLWSAFCCGSGLTHCFTRSRLFNPEAIPNWRRDTVREVDIVTGCFFLIRRRLWTQLNGFDPGFFMYGEEADLCLRARTLGIRCLICPDAQVVHYGGASDTIRADRVVRLFCAKAQLFQKHWTRAATRCGVLTLDFWAFSRTLAYWPLHFIGREATDNYDTWRSIWRRRCEWHGAQTLTQECRRQADNP